MHAYILHVFFIRRNVGLCRKSAQSFAEDEDSKWVNTRNQDIDSQVELQAIDQIWPTEVSLNNAMLRRIDVLKFPCQEDSVTLRHALRFNDVRSGLAFGFALKIRLEVQIISGQVPSKRKVVVLIRHFLAHLHKVLGQQIFARESIHARKVINLLMMLHLHEHLRSDSPVSPPNIPFRNVGVIFHLPFQ